MLWAIFQTTQWGTYMKTILLILFAALAIFAQDTTVDDTVVAKIDSVKMGGKTLYTSYTKSGKVCSVMTYSEDDILSIKRFNSRVAGHRVDSSIILKVGKNGVRYTSKSYEKGLVILTAEQYAKPFKAKGSIFGQKDTAKYNVHEMRYLGDSAIEIFSNTIMSAFRFPFGKSRKTTTRKGRIISEYVRNFTTYELRSYRDTGTFVTKGDFSEQCKGLFDKDLIKGTLECYSKDSTHLVDTIFRGSSNEYKVEYFDHMKESIDSVVVVGVWERTFYKNGHLVDEQPNRILEYDSTGYLISETQKFIYGKDSIEKETIYGKYYDIIHSNNRVNRKFDGEQLDVDTIKKWKTVSTWKSGKLLKWRRNSSSNGDLYIWGKCKENKCSVFDDKDNFVRCTFVDSLGYYDQEDLPRNECN